MSKITIALDGMGGDFAPEETIKAALEAVKGDPELRIIWVGESSALSREAREAFRAAAIATVPGVKVPERAEAARFVARQRDASVLVAATLVREGEAEAAVSMGPTGATLAAASLAFEKFTGLSRPVGLAPFTRRSILIDGGANIDCRPEQFLQFAAIGTVYCREFMDIGEPTVALLSIGREAGKGGKTIREAYELLEEDARVNFVGNIEGYDLVEGPPNVILCDGSLGNVVVKFREGLQALLERLFPAQAEELVRELDWIDVSRELGGAPLIGVRGVLVAGHGAATAPVIERAIGQAKRAIQTAVIGKIEAALERL